MAVKSTSSGGKVFFGRFWDLIDDNQKQPPRFDLCTVSEAEVKGKDRDIFLAGLYQQKLNGLKAEKAKEAQKRFDSTLIATVMQKWLDSVASLRSQDTAKYYLQSVNHYIRCVGDHRIEDFSHEFNNSFVEYLKGQKNKKGGVYSTATQIRHIRAIQTFFNWAYKKEYVSRIIKLDKPIAEKREIEIFRMDDLKELEELIKNKIKATGHPTRRRYYLNHLRTFYLSIYTIMRRSAIWSLTLDRIDLKNRIIRIRNNKELNWFNKKNKQVDKPIKSYS